MKVECTSIHTLYDRIQYVPENEKEWLRYVSLIGVKKSVNATVMPDKDLVASESEWDLESEGNLLKKGAISIYWDRKSVV